MKNLILALALTVSCCPSFASRLIGATPAQKVDQIVSIFENSTPEIQYDYIAALGDGRGYTAGRAGFTTATGDLLEVVEQYAKLKPSGPQWPRLRALLPKLRELSDDADGSVVGLELLPALWKTASDDPKFLIAQDLVAENLYKEPARKWCRRLKLASAFSFLVIYDSIIQHGDGGDRDSLGALVSKVKSTNEPDFLREFLSIRRADLMNPANSDTRDEWRESVDRVDALKRIFDTKNFELASPLQVDVWGKSYAL